MTIPSSVTKIWTAAFEYCPKLSSLIVESGNSVYDSRNNCNAIIETATNTLIVGCKNTEIPNTVTSIGRAFTGCSELTSISFPNNVTSIGAEALKDCTSLTSVLIPNSITTIAGGTFQGCIGLTTVTIPNSVKTIGNKAFDGWFLPTVISEIENPSDIEIWAFSEDTFKNATLYVPVGTIDKYKAREGWKKFIFIEEGSPSGITNVEGEGTNENRRYSIDGKVVKNPRKGINIINGKKVIIK